MNLNTGKANYCPADANKVVHSTEGALLGIVASHGETTAQTVILYDNSAASGDVLLKVTLPASCAPVSIFFPERVPLRFVTGLAVTPGKCNVFVITAA